MAAAVEAPPCPALEASTSSQARTSRVHARIGLLGNPSDGFYGKTISFSLRNFYAETFNNLDALVTRIEREGYYGGIRLLMATCKQFTCWCKQHDVQLPQKGFQLSYETNIPRQAGLSGSSALVCAALNCLMQYYGVGQHIPKVQRPSLVLSAEQELGITAGLQDRVIQVYGGLVYMDFSKATMVSHGHGSYSPLDPQLLPRLWLVWCDNPSDSGKVHSTVKQRWLAGDHQVVEEMEQVAACAEEGRLALEERDTAALARLMNRNFDLRRSMFGDAALGALNLKMIQVARSVGAAAKFTGSGGAIVAFCPEGAEQEQRLQGACKENGFQIVLAEVAPPAE